MAQERHFAMRWPELNASIECKPLDYNHALYDWWLDRFPIKARQDHALVSGELMYALNVRVPQHLPVFKPGELTTRLMTEAPVGFGRFGYNQRCGLTGGRIGAIVVIYGPLMEAIPAGYCFRVVEKDIEKLKEVGRRVWNAIYKTKEIIFVELSVKK